MPPQTLRDYQQSAIDSLRASFAAGNKRVVLVLPTGAGKTTILAEILRLSNRQSLVVAHRRELIGQISERLHGHGLPDHGIIMAGVKPWDARIQVASIQTLARRELPPADLLIIDECFPRGTIVDGVAIENIRPGDVVHGKTVARTMARVPTTRLLSVSSGGSSLSCTENHPLLTRRGWIQAGQLHETDYVRQLRRGDREKAATQEPQSAMCEVPGASSARQKEGNNAAIRTREGIINAVGHEASPENPGWQWQRHDKSRVVASAYAGRWLGLESTDKDRNSSLLLQAGSDKSGHDGLRRNRRPVSLQPALTREGCEEDEDFEWTRVDRVAVHERTGDGTFGGVCPDGLVYNLELDVEPTYVANGFVVHNCHHITTKNTYGRILETYKNTPLVGLTATPRRLDRQGLGDVFDDMVIGAVPGQLRDLGFLAPYRGKAFREPDELAKVKTVLGDYDIHGLCKIYEQPKLLGDIVALWLQHARSKRTIAFVPSIKASVDLVDRIKAAGIAAEHLDYKAPKAERQAILDRVRSGETQFVSNVALLGEGLDIPELECCIIARPTKSIALYLQCVGRCARPAPGKTEAFLLDHGGTVERHGHPYAAQDWTLETTKPKTPGPGALKTCPKCFAVLEGAPAVCPECGEVFHVERPPPITVHDVVALDIDAVNQAAAGTQDDFRRLLQKHRALGHPPGWAVGEWHGRFGKLDPPWSVWREFVKPGKGAGWIAPMQPAPRLFGWGARSDPNPDEF